MYQILGRVMKVLAIVGSLRKDSINMKAAKAFELALGGEGSVEYAILSDVPMFNQDIPELPAAINRISKQILEADSVLFATPEYNYSIPGMLKNTIDWLSRHEDKPFDGKPAAVMGASPGG